MNLEPQIVADFKNYFILYKPPGWFVHSPSDSRARKLFRDFILTEFLKKKLGFKPHPVHRLDFATEGILIWAKDAAATGVLSRKNEQGEIAKLYHAVVRGFLSPLEGVIDIPLISDSSFEELACKTEYKTLQQLELPVSINSSHKSSRYSLLEVQLHTGRWHQIRRHMNRISHPIIGDREHGDSHHNRHFRDQLNIPQLLLKSTSLAFLDPFDGAERQFHCPVSTRWQHVYNLFSRSTDDPGLKPIKVSPELW